jgi:hypothetical protein
MSEDAYYTELETILRKIAEIIHGNEGIPQP